MTDDEQAQAVLEMLTTRKWEVQDQAGRYIITEREILRIYYDEWVYRMYRALRQDEINALRQDEIDAESCIQDFVMVHFAKELT